MLCEYNQRYKRSSTMTLNSNLVNTPEGIEPSYLSALAQVALQARAYHGLATLEAPIHMADIEADGRRAKRAARDLINAALIREDTKRRGVVDDSSVHYVVRIVEVLPYIARIASAPSLTAHINDWNRGSILEGRAPIGVEFAQLTLGEQLWVTSHPHEYRWCWVGLHKEIVWHPGNPLPDNHWRMKLQVSDDALRAEFEGAIRTRKVASMMARNVGWAMENLAEIDPETIKTFMTLGDRGIMNGEELFSGDPATWAAAAQQFMARAHARLIDAMKKVEASSKIAEAMLKYGGWDKLGVELRAKVETKIDAKEDDNEEGAS